MLVQSCPHCRAYTSLQALPITTGLGAPSYVCGHCDLPFLTSRREWADMNGYRKSWYLINSVLIMIAIASFLAKMLAEVAAALFSFDSGHWAFGAVFWFDFLGVSLALGYLQVMRIEWSLRRTKGTDLWSPATAFWCIDTNHQFLVLLIFAFLMILPASVAMVVQNTPETETNTEVIDLQEIYDRAMEEQRRQPKGFFDPSTRKMIQIPLSQSHE